MMRARVLGVGMLVLVASACASGGMEFDPANVPPPSTDGPYSVLVAPLTAEGGASDGFGSQVASHIETNLEPLATHLALDRDLARSAAAYYELDYNQLTCIQAMQLAGRLNAQLAVCGTYTEAAGGFRVDAEVVEGGGDMSFEVEPFTAASPEEAARQITTKFQDYLTIISNVRFCSDNRESGDYERALETCDRALAVDPQNRSALYQKAETYNEMGNLEEALALYQQVLEVDPLHGNAMYQGGIVATKLGQEELAREYFEEYLEVNPVNVDVRLRLADEIARAGDPYTAYQMLEEGIQVDTVNDLRLKEYAGHYALAAAQRPEVGEAEANRFFRTTLNYYEDVLEAREAAGETVQPNLARNMVSVLVRLEEEERAISMAERILATTEEADAHLLFTYARALKTAGRTADAIGAMNEAIEAGLDPIRGYTSLTEWLAEEGDLSEVRRVLAAAQQQDVPLDPIAMQIIRVGSERFNAGQRSASTPYFQLAREYATTTQTRGMASFWAGYSIYDEAVDMTNRGEITTLAMARRALPMFRSAMEYFQRSDAEAYAAGAAGVNLESIVKSTNQLIARYSSIIERGR